MTMDYMWQLHIHHLKIFIKVHVFGLHLNVCAFNMATLHIGYRMGNGEKSNQKIQIFVTQ